jgi:hypothetical protein
MPQLAGTILVGNFIKPIANGVGLRLYGQSSGFVGLSPANHAGGTTFLLPASDGSVGQALTTNGSGELGWSNFLSVGATPNNGELLVGNGSDFSLATLTAGDNITITNGPGSITIAASGGSGSPGGDDTQIQFNSGGSFAASADLSWNATNHQLKVNNTITTSNDELILEQSGDSFGGTRFYLRNRIGFNGFVVENLGIDLTNMVFINSSGARGLVRYEHRVGAFVDGDNTDGEFQYWVTPSACSLAIGSSITVLATSLRLADGANLVVGSGTGSRIGSSADQKLGFFGATPVSQRLKSNYNNWASHTDVVQALVDLGLFDQV